MLTPSPRRVMGSRCKPWNTESGSDIAADQCGDLQHLHCRAARSSLPAKIDRPPYQTLHMARGFEIRAELLARRTRPDVDQGRTHRSGETNVSPKTTVDSLFDVRSGSPKLSTTVSGSHHRRRAVWANSDRRSVE